jgi:cob(I)alamin adenosyltransferase
LKIYTKTGDRGETGLSDGSRVPKSSLRVAAYGDIDELNAVLGMVRAGTQDRAQDSLLQGVQRDLFALGAQLADPSTRVVSRKAKVLVTAAEIERLEQAIDSRDERLPPLRTFILPGGSPIGAHLHLARTVCRRAERSLAALNRETPVEPLIVVYLNRLSDLLFVLAREANHDAGKPEEAW